MPKEARQQSDLEQRRTAFNGFAVLRSASARWVIALRRRSQSNPLTGSEGNANAVQAIEPLPFGENGGASGKSLCGEPTPRTAALGERLLQRAGGEALSLLLNRAIIQKIWEGKPLRGFPSGQHSNKSS